MSTSANYVKEINIPQSYSEIIKNIKEIKIGRAHV